MATIKDIARELNISVSTVSYALNNGPRSVPAEVKKNVLQTAQRLGYRPNRNARSLITGKTHAIGIIPTDLGADVASGPFFLQALNGIVNEAEITQYDVVLFTRYDQSDIEPFLNNVLDGRVDGVIFLAPPTNSIAVDLIRDHGLPAVIAGGHSRSIPTYCADNSTGVEEAIEHLYSLGHRKIGHISGRHKLDDSEARNSAFKSSLAKHHLELNESWCQSGDFMIDGGYAAGFEILRTNNRPTALFCSNDEMAFGVLRAARELNIDVPTQLSVIGFDDAPGCQFCYPALTTIRQPVERIATQALRSLVGVIEDKFLPPSRQFPTELIVRASTSSPLKDNINEQS